MRCVFFVVGLSRAAHGAHCTFKIALSQAIMFTLMFVCAFSPTGTQYPAGSPLIHLKLQGITQASVNSRRTPTSYAYTRIRSCKRIGHQYEYTQSHRVINCAFDQTNTFYLFVCLLLVYSFSPRVQSIPRGSPNNAAMVFYAAIVLCASTRQNGKCD